jgi:hypothetical protein
MKINWKEKACHIEIENSEMILITSARDKTHFLQVEIDKFDDIIFKKREKLK